MKDLLVLLFTAPLLSILLAYKIRNLAKEQDMYKKEDEKYLSLASLVVAFSLVFALIGFYVFLKSVLGFFIN